MSLKQLLKLSAVAAALALGACALQQEPSAALGRTGTDIINRPERHVGERVTVSGIVNEVYSPGSFTVGPDGFLKSDLRVVTRGPLVTPPRLAPGDRVRVTGLVRIFRWQEFQRGYRTGFYGSGLGLYGYGRPYAVGPGFYGVGTVGYPTYYVRWEERPIIVAHQVTRLR